MAFPAEQRQAAWLEAMSEAATVENIQGWDSFREALTSQAPDAKQAWIQRGVKMHDLQSQCGVILTNQPR